MRIIKLIIWSILILYWQYLVAPHLSVSGFIPNFVLPLIIFLNLLLQIKIALPLTFFLGLALDLFYPSLLGLNSIALITVSFLIQVFHHSINKERLLVVFFSVLFLNLVYYSFFLLYYIVSGNRVVFQDLNFLLALIYNGILSTIFIYFLVFLNRLELSWHD
ncbi:MAG: rod shape-determining protein MreD [Candidatus Cloacimonetes bacterium]|nr:rod shape-determining protein MreD [Candidatus Cloacimonadota bacterium]